MKNIKYLISTFSLLALFLGPPPALADDVIYAGYAPATGNYISYCNGTYFGLMGQCNFTRSFFVTSDQLATAITFFDLGCNSRDAVELFLAYRLVNADTHEIVADTIHKRHLICTPDYPEGHNIPTTLEIPPTKLKAHQEYQIILRSPNDERVRAYWGVSAATETSFQVHGSPFPRGSVILVPGIMGSSLKRVSDGTEAWPKVNEMVLSGGDAYLDDLKLDSGGGQIAGKEMKPGNMIERASFSLFGQNIVTQTFYGDLVRQFTDNGYILGKDLFEVAYDWRLGLEGQTARLEEAVATARAAAPGNKLSIVAHSMGGLLAKQYLSEPENASLIDKVVLVGTPQLGAPAMFKVLSYGDNLGFQFPIVEKDLLNSAKVKDIAQNMPGVYELLPSKQYVNSAGGYIKDFREGRSKILSHEETKGLMTSNPSDSRNLALLSAGQKLHDNLDQRPIAGPKVYNVAGCGDPATIGEIRLYDDGKIDIAGTDGDGTVPLMSAMHLANGYTNYFVPAHITGINHSQLVKDEQATFLIGRLAEGGGLPSDMDTAIATSSSVCSESSWSGLHTLRFSTHSPVALHVYDSEGRHTGPGSEDGIVELGIPGSTHITLGNNSFVFVPATETYRVVVDGLAAGRFTLKSQTLKGSSVVASTNYLDVPLAGSDSTAEAIFSSANPAPGLSLDSNGDGTIDADIAPTANLLGAAAADLEPPQISFSGIPTSTIVAGTPFTIMFSATDHLSGVATTSATLNGAPFLSGDTLTSQLVGKQAIVIQAADKAGNPKALTVEFDQTAATSNQPAAPQPIGGGSHSQSSGSQRSGNNSKKSAKKSNDLSEPGSILGAATIVSSGNSNNGLVTKTAVSSSAPTACLPVPSVVMRRGKSNELEQVILLQKFLNQRLSLSIPLTGFFGPITELAVKVFQLKNHNDVLAPAGLSSPSGFVGKYTLAKIKALACVQGSAS